MHFAKTGNAVWDLENLLQIPKSVVLATTNKTENVVLLTVEIAIMIRVPDVAKGLFVIVATSANPIQHVRTLVKIVLKAAVVPREIAVRAYAA